VHLASVVNRGLVVATTFACALASAAPDTVDPYLKKLVDDLNSRLPATVDRNTRLDTASAGPGLRITYYYTITSHEAAALNVPRLRGTLIPASRAKVCTSPDTRALLDAKVIYTYHYNDRNGHFVTRFEISRADCK
jgi:hypothetical protein